METDSGQRATMRRREGARGRRERRLRAEARIRLQLCRDAVRVASHRGGEGCQSGRGLRAALRPTDTEATSPGDAASTRYWRCCRSWEHSGTPWTRSSTFLGYRPLDGPVPLMVEQLVDVLQLFDALIPVAEQVIDVPNIFIERIPPRTSVREPQLAEQLVEVPTIAGGWRSQWRPGPRTAPVESPRTWTNEGNAARGAS